MKRCKKITGWTDYPFYEFGDQPGEEAPIRRVRVLSYDGNKYVKIAVDGFAFPVWIKAGYLYGKKGRLLQVKQINIRKLERMIPDRSESYNPANR